MDLAYDHIAEESFPKDSNANNSNDNNQNAESSSRKQPENSLNEDLQEAYRAFSSSSWGTWLGGTVGNVIKQGESVYREAQQEVTLLSADATRGLASLRARAISLTTPPIVTDQPQHSGDREKDAETTPTAAKAGSSDEATKESETVISRLKAEAAKRLKDIQRAEEAADDALLKFGGNVRNFFRDAIIVKPAADNEDSDARRFESKDDSGKRVIHTSRYDAQIHVLHTTEKSFTEDPASAEYVTWSETFDLDGKTESISTDLAKYPELRVSMERLVPDKVPYADFWQRYYFLRHSIETSEARRRDLLKAASAEEEIGWGEESDEEESSEEEEEEEESDDEEEDTTPSKSIARPARPASTESSTTIHPPKAAAADKSQPKPAEPRKSNDEKSQPDSDTSYDVVGAASGNPSQAPSSPKESRKVEDSDSDSEDDEWE